MGPFLGGASNYKCHEWFKVRMNDLMLERVVAHIYGENSSSIDFGDGITFTIYYVNQLSNGCGHATPRLAR